MGYDKSDILAIIVSFNPSNIIKKNVESLMQQVGNIIVCDNGSSCGSRRILYDIDKIKKCKVIYNNQNKGIAFRLNEGLKMAKDMGCKLILTMDQDTVLKEDCVKSMLAILNSDEKVGSVGPARVVRNMNREYYYKDYLITSGNLSRVDVVESAGCYMDELFVDLIDIDISLAIRNKGYKLAIANNSKMEHVVGEKEKSIVLGGKIEYYTHSAKRFYYIYRNLILINKKHMKKHFLFCVKLDINHFFSFFRLLIEQDRKNKYSELIKGVSDGLKMKVIKA